MQAVHVMQGDIENRAFSNARNKHSTGLKGLGAAPSKPGMAGTLQRKALGDITNSRSGKGLKEDSRKDNGAVFPDEIEATSYRGEDDDVYTDPTLDEGLPRLLRSANISGGGGGAFGAALQMEVRGSRIALPDDLPFRPAAFEPEPVEVFAADDGDAVLDMLLGDEDDGAAGDGDGWELPEMGVVDGGDDAV